MSIPTTDQRLKNLILREVGDTVPNNAGPVGSVIDALWDINAQYAVTGIPLHQYYYTKIAALSVMIGSLALGESVEIGTKNNSLDDKVPTLQKILATTQDALSALERKYRALRPPVIGTMTNVAPITPSTPDTYGDANARQYRGDPYVGNNGYYGTGNNKP